MGPEGDEICDLGFGESMGFEEFKDSVWFFSVVEIDFFGSRKSSFWRQPT